MDVKLFLRAQWDRAAACSLAVLGAVTLLLGWLGVSGSALTAEQLPYLVSGGLGGIALIGIGATLWLSADLRDEWRRIDRLEHDLLEVAQLARGSEAGAHPVAHASDAIGNGSADRGPAPTVEAAVAGGEVGRRRPRRSPT